MTVRSRRVEQQPWLTIMPCLNDMFMLVRKQHTTNKSDASYILYIVLKFLPTESELCYKMHII